MKLLTTISALVFTSLILIVSSCNGQKKSEESGFTKLFNGTDLDGWIGNKQSYRVVDGAIVVHPNKGEGGGNLYTTKQYENFILRFEFKLTPGANNGLGIHAPLEGD